MAAYAFKDTTQRTGTDSSSLSAESIKINGTWLENVITGFRVLNVSGRESMSAEVESYKTGSRHGSGFLYRRYPERVITVTYQLLASSDSAFRTAYNLLGQYLNTENAEIIFNDETDKFFIGTPTEVEAVDPGINTVVGAFQIKCLDPFKYAVTERVVTGSTLNINYAGSKSCFPQIEVDFYRGSESDAESNRGACGFVAIYDDNGNAISFGDPNEPEAPHMLMYRDYTNKSSSAWNSESSQWALNTSTSHIMPYTEVTASGTATLIDVSGLDETVKGIGASSYGSGTGWHGPTLTKSLSQAVTDFTVKYTTRFRSSAAAQNMQQVSMLTADGKALAAVNINKWKKGGTTASLQFYINDEKVAGTDIDVSLLNESACWIRKTGKEIVFNVYGVRLAFARDDLEDTAASKIMMGFFTFADATQYTNLRNAITMLSVQADNNSGIVSNQFGTNDVLIADCESADVYLNGTYSPQYGRIENAWEDFELKPGTNVFNTIYSDWVQAAYAPTFKMRFREVWI